MQRKLRSLVRSLFLQRVGALSAPSKPNSEPCKSSLASACILFLSEPLRSSPRRISIGQLHASQHFHLRPINDIVYVEPYSFRMRDLILGGVSRLDAFSVYLVQT